MKKTKDEFLKYAKSQGMTKEQEELFNKEYELVKGLGGKNE